MNNTPEMVTYQKEISTSFGIINIYLSGEINKYTDFFKQTFENNEANINIMTIDSLNFDYSANNDNLSNKNNDGEYFLNLYKIVSESVMFLLVSRKHSLGYIDFVRGKYEIDDFTSINHLFVQMTSDEIDFIFNSKFDTLWYSMWKKNAKKSLYYKEYNISKNKFLEILNLYTINDFKPKFPIREWGFPKGRKNGNESNICCALRECCEETSLFKSEICILHGITPLVELMVGTNNIQYKHIYFLSMMNNIRILDLDNDGSNFIEIENAGWFKKERALNLIRPYHHEKINIINKIIYYITYSIYCIYKVNKLN